MNSYYLKNPTLAAVSSQTSYLLVLPNREPLVFNSEEGAAIQHVLQVTARPTPKEELLALSSLEALAMLVEFGVLFEGSLEELVGVEEALPERPCKHLVVGVSGSIACSATLALCLRLSRFFCDRLDVVFTEAALKFIRAESFQYRGINTWTDAFTPRPEAHVPHIHLASAEMVLILPASANTIFKLAQGACSDLLSLVVSATRAPVVLAPAMNLAMLNNPAILRNINQLRSDGMYIIEPSSGVPASKGPLGEAEVGAIGVNELTICATLDSILTLHKTKT